MSCRPKTPNPSLTKNNRLANAALAALAGHVLPKLKPARKDTRAKHANTKAALASKGQGIDVVSQGSEDEESQEERSSVISEGEGEKTMPKVSC